MQEREGRGEERVKEAEKDMRRGRNIGRERQVTIDSAKRRRTRKRNGREKWRSEEKVMCGS